MSLDVYLRDKQKACAHCGRGDEEHEGFSDNITHNLSEMADHAGIYLVLWRPEEIGATKANHIIEPLKAGLALLKSDPDKFKKFSPDNGWGTYEGFVDFVERYLKACEDKPNSEIEVSR